ncbi:MAG TPA: ATP-binding protein [Mycobacteriales bacterium]|nr:ATP-binding protein [Mycobacteriales bacterium]
MLTIASVDLPPDAASVQTARDVVREVADHLPRRAREAADLVTSELVTNSVVHAQTPFELFAAADDAAVEVVVADRTGWVTTHRASATRGHGLLLVDLLATDWAAELEPAGKRVWARLLVEDVPTC